MTAPLLTLDRLAYRIAERTLFEDLSFTLAGGERASVIGPSGVGKTTLLRLIAGLAAPSAGKILIHDQIASEEHRVLLPPWKRGIHLVFQDLGLWPTRSVLQNVSDARKAARLPQVKERSLALLEALGIAALAKRRPESLSGGEARRLAFARAMAVEPDLLLLDEPFAHLDQDSRDAGFALLEELLEKSDMAVMMVTHREEEAQKLGGKRLILSPPGMSAPSSSASA